MVDKRPHNTIRTFALVCVAVTSVFVMAMVIWLLSLLSDPGWCDRAIGAAKDAALRQNAFAGCFSLLTQQMSALAINSYVFGAVIALCLLALMIIVVAGGRLSFKGTKDGVEANISSATDVAATVTTTTTVETPVSSPQTPEGEETKDQKEKEIR